MGEETTRLRQEIEQTRDDLTRDVDLLAEKTSPSRIVERRVQRTRRGIAGLKDRVMGSSHGYTVTGAPSHGSVSDRASSVTGSVQSSVQGAIGDTTDQAKDVVRSARHQAEGNPLAAGVIAFGVGWLVSSLLPATEQEKTAARRATEQAKAHGGPVMDQAKQAAQDVGGSLKESAQDKAQQVKEHAQDAAQVVREESTSAASSVKDEARAPGSSADSPGPASTGYAGGTTSPANQI